MMLNETVRNEPFGHLVPETKLERYWSQSSGLVCLRRHRVVRFDPHACATYAPTAYISTPIELRRDLPADDWIVDSLRGFIRIEFSERKKKLPEPDFTPPSISEIEDPDVILDALIRQTATEVEQIISEFSREAETSSPDELARQIYRLLCHPRIGATANLDNVSESDFVSIAAPTIKAQERLFFVLLGFPFKDQNRFRVQDDADQPDIGEISFLLRLFRATQAIYQIHPYGADVLVLTDGQLYQKILGVSEASVTRYAERLKAYRSYLNLQGAISFIPLSSLVERASPDPLEAPNATSANAVREHISRRILEVLNSESSLQELFDVLVSGIKWNHESRDHLADLSPRDAWHVLTAPKDQVDQNLRNRWMEFHAKAHAAAIEYAATNLMLRWLDLVRLYFPDAIRCTIHAKPGQICLARSSAAFPWNGVAWTSDWPASIDYFEVRPWYTLNELGPIRKVEIRTIGAPYFYTRATKGSNILAAKNVLPSSGWAFGDIQGRHFVVSDVDALAVLGAGDENFAWERIPQTENYYHRILKFRLDHYQQFGFGIHGLWLDGHLIGQCGLQVLNETRDQVELVIFLGKAHVRKGFGLRLSRHILSRCGSAGVKAVHGVVRPENQAALDLLRRLGARPIRTQVHFGYIATVFSIPLGPA